jgi:enolase
VLKAVEHVNTEISEAIVGLDATEQAFVDKTLIDLDGTDNKSRLGCERHPRGVDGERQGGRPRSRAAALPLPRRRGRDAHAGADDERRERRRARQQPARFPGVHDRPGEPAELSRGAALRRRGISSIEASYRFQRHVHAVGDEGGFAPADLATHSAAIELITEAIDKAGYRAGQDVVLALDCAASEFYHDGAYVLESEGKRLSSAQLSDYLADLVARFPIVSIEDGMAENDWDGWKTLTDRLGGKVQLVGDDLFVTNSAHPARGYPAGRGELDPHQGQPDRHPHRDLRRDRARQARGLRHGAVAPLRRDRGHHHRRRRGGHQRAADQDRIAVALDRVAKYNQLLRIEEDLGDSVDYPGREAFGRFG